MPTRNPFSELEPRRRPFGAVRLAQPVPPAPAPEVAHPLPSRQLGPSVPLPVLSIKTLRRLP
ncbi:hypothetical protein ABIA33_007063 [Streptacidiphilus sp. MAP12-16]